MSSESNNHQRPRKKENKPKRTSSKVQQELAKARDTLREKEKDLIACKKDLEQVSEELEALKATGAEPILEEEEASLLKGSPRASYRIDLYPHEGRYLVKMKHLLTRDEKTLQGLDSNAIMEFISAYLPLTDEQQESGTPPTKSDETPATRPTPTERLPSCVLRVVPKEEGKQRQVLCHEEPFEVSLTLDLEAVAFPTEEPVQHKVTIYAKPLLGGPKRVLGKAQGVITSTEKPTIRMFAKAPPEGTYRLEAAATLRATSGRQISTASPIEGNVVQVF